MRYAPSVALFTCTGAVPKSLWLLGVVLAGLLVVGLPARAVRADTILDSGTTTVSTDTNFGGVLVVGFQNPATLNVTGGLATSGTGYLGYFPGVAGTATVSSGTLATSNSLYVGYLGTGELIVSGGSVTLRSSGQETSTWQSSGAAL